LFENIKQSNLNWELFRISVIETAFLSYSILGWVTCFFIWIRKRAIKVIRIQADITNITMSIIF
jgi:hypothetical protein